MAEPTSKKGRVRRVRKNQPEVQEDASEVTSEAADTSNPDTQEDASVTSANVASVETVAAMATNLVEDMIDDVVDTVAGRTAEPAQQPAPQPLNRRQLAATKARQMRLTTAKDWLNQGKLTNAKQRLFEILASAPNSAESAEAEELILDLAARYEASGKSRLALELYDKLARYD
ncbi:MAG: hypothetical protein AAF267_08340 [Deinococcota bacterium]